MKTYDLFDWYWIVAGDASRVFSSKLHDYVLPSDPAYVDWAADGSAPIEIDTEHSLGAVMAASGLLRPIPAGVLDGYTDMLALRIAQQPDFTLWVELYQQVLSLPNVTAVLSHIKTKL
ncbi:hypothetical protein ABID65_006717 [Bradyrhizobium sp. S3.9.2]|uniref:hypothetical protein n=1 Tax=Bradyrhizobium sp. S3.9.2 TaxID=3156432 RepID=UPI0033987711